MYSHEIVRVEYFIDKDPGFGQGIEIKKTESEKIDFVAELEKLGIGPHILYIRAMDSEFKWTQTKNIPFFINAEKNEKSLSRVEYFIDKDPGLFNGVEIKSVDGEKSEFTIPCTDIQAGGHLLYIRSIDSDGYISTVKTVPFYMKSTQMLQEFTNYTGGAHDNAKIATTNINLKNGTTLTLADVLAKGSDYKERIECMIDKEQGTKNKK